MKISVIFGTRPEAIKLCPLIMLLRDHPEFLPNICVTAQHREMLDQVLSVFAVKADVDLNLMRPDQSLAQLTADAIIGISNYLSEYKPEMVIVQGDTTTVLSASLAASYNKIPIGHIEAGLRSGDSLSPWPEEINRTLTSHLSALHFAPTEWSKKNLVNEGINPNMIFITGNTVIDSLFIAVDRVTKSPPFIDNLPYQLQPCFTNTSKPKIVLITCHRRESFGKSFENICCAIKKLAKHNPKFHFIYPVHPNPNLKKTIKKILGDNVNKNIHLLRPLSYLEFVAIMRQSYIILTDSGGLQEEGSSLGIPVLVMRNRTERPEGIKSGTIRLVGTESNKIFSEVSNLLLNRNLYNEMAKATNPFGDGKASERIVKIIHAFKHGKHKGYLQ